MSRPRLHAPLTRPAYADLERQLAEAQADIEQLQRGISCKQPSCPNPKTNSGYCHHHRYLRWD